MRFRRLSLDAFGPFTGTALDFTRAHGNGLHLVYGPNEAGKSSALRAIRDLLFGIPQQTPDAHLHPSASLRISALIERGGEELEFARRKKRKDSLVGPNEQPLEEARLARFLNGLDAGSFDRLFALDHERLARGAEETLSGQGDVGEALFDAGASGRSVHRVKLQLAAEADELFKDRAQKPQLNQLLALYAEQKKRAKDSLHSPERYEEQLEGVRDKRREAEARRAELSRLRADKDHAVRLRNVLSSVAERDRKSAERERIGPLPSLRRDAGERREQLVAGVALAERDRERLSKKLAEELRKLEQLAEPGPALALPKDAARAIGTRIGRAEKDLDDLPKLEARARAMRDGIQSDLRRLGLGSDLESVLSRSLPVAEQARLEALGREHQGLSLKLESAERELPEARARVETQTAILRQTRAARRIERERLLPVEVLERFDGQLAQAEEALEALGERLREDERERAALVHQLELLQGQQGVPSAALLAEARSAREARLREAQELAADPKRKALELCLPLAALAQATVYADALADRLRSEAQRVADAELLEQRLAKQARERERLLEARQQAQEALSEVASRWERAQASLGLSGLLPREAARLLQEEREGWRELQRQEQDLARAQAAHAALDVRADEARRALGRWNQDWRRAVAPLGLAEDARPDEALALLGGLSELLSERDKLLELQRRVDGLRRDIDQFAALVRAQVEALAPELAALPPTEAAERLLEQHRRASELAAQRSAIEAERGRTRKELSDVEARYAALAQQLSELCREAGVADALELAELEQKVMRARELEAELLHVDARLAEVCEGEDVATLVEEARRSDKGAVAARLAELEDLITVREEESRELERDLTRLDMGLQVYGGRDGADAAQELSATVARLAELSAAWVRRRLAAVVLERVVDGYRERHQQPVLTRASELFARLTLGRFARLQVGLEETRLECVEADSGRGLELEQLSRGARFQLYLALKLASLEEYLKTAPPLPLVLDDVLVEWDDERSRVALSVLAEFSERQQILLFTHHGRDVAAAEALADGRIFTHHLAPRAPRPRPHERALT